MKLLIQSASVVVLCFFLAAGQPVGQASPPQVQDASAVTPSDQGLTYYGRLLVTDDLAQGAVEVLCSIYDQAEGGSLIGTSAAMAFERADKPFAIQLGALLQGQDVTRLYLEWSVRPAGAADFTVLSPRQSLADSSKSVNLSGGSVGMTGGLATRAGRSASEEPSSTSANENLALSQEIRSGSSDQLPTQVQPQDDMLLASAGCLDGPGGNPVDALCIDADGDVGIGLGNTPAVARLEVASSSVNPGTAIRIDAFDVDPLNNNLWSVMSTGMSNPELSFGLLVRDEFFGVTRLAIDGFGDVGIGTTSPLSRLDVDGNVTIGDVSPLGIAFRGNGELNANTGIGHPANNILTFITDNAERVRVNGLGNVGIGTNAPAVRLHVEGGTDVSPAGGGFLQLGAGTDLNVAFDNNEIMARNNGVIAPLALNNEGGNVFMGVTGDTNLGIGTNNPVRTIQAQDTQSVLLLFSQNAGNGSVVELANNTAGATFLGAINFCVNPPSAPGQIAYTLTNNMIFSTNSVERMRINDAGNVGIGIASPTDKLNVAGNARVTGTVFTDFVSSDSPLALQTNGVTHILIQDDGKVAIGSPPPSPAAEALDVEGCIKADCATIDGNLDVSGNATIDGNATIGGDITVTGCVAADCFILPDGQTFQISPLHLVKAGVATVSVLPNTTGSVTVRPTVAGVQNALIPVSLPSELLGLNHVITKMKICYRVKAPSSFITQTRLRLLNGDGSVVNLIDDTTDRTSTAWNCFELDVTAMPNPSIKDAAISILFDLNYSGAGSAHDIEFGPVTMTAAQVIPMP